MTSRKRSSGNSGSGLPDSGNFLSRDRDFSAFWRKDNAVEGLSLCIYAMASRNWRRPVGVNNILKALQPQDKGLPLLAHRRVYNQFPPLSLSLLWRASVKYPFHAVRFYRLPCLPVQQPLFHAV